MAGSRVGLFKPRDGSGRLIAQAPTGSGKSTQIPQMPLRNGLLVPRTQ